MKLEKMRIRNFRQFQNTIINYHDTLTILAGANNSGKTSLIELYNNLFSKGENTLSIDDMSVYQINQVLKNLSQEINKIYLKESEHTLNKLEFLNQINNFISEEDNLVPNFNSSTLFVDIEIKYDKRESIGSFSDYLMELGDLDCSFYFRYALELNRGKFFKLLKMHYEDIIDMLFKHSENPDDNIITNELTDFLSQIYGQSIENKYYYCDKQYEILIAMTSKNFKDLFHYNYIGATRLLNDEKIDGHFSISKEMLSIFQLSPEWDTLKKDMPKDLKRVIGNCDVKEKIKADSMKGLQDVLGNISAVLDNNAANFFLDAEFNDKNLMDFLTSVLQTYYQYGDGSTLKESSQGLGISNLIYMCLKLDRFSKEYKSEIVNFFVIEEPEAHMHPQMERILVNHLNNDFKNKHIQGIITTHSHEIVKASKLDTIRVIRKIELFNNKIFDMSEFKNQLSTDEEKNFFTFLFSINYSDLIFANKIIMYEGDTEKMYLEKLLTDKKYESLSRQYISYVQVGGAYAHWYRKLIYFLGIKTLILTDIDYGKRCVKVSDICSSVTTNIGLKNYYIDDLIYGDISTNILTQCNSCKMESADCFKNKSPHEQVCIARDNAICGKIIVGDRITKKEKKEWKKTKDGNKLIFSIPNKTKDISVRDILKSSKDSKTDFMYSVILNNLHMNMLPDYIEEGLNWLIK